MAKRRKTTRRKKTSRWFSAHKPATRTARRKASPAKRKGGVRIYPGRWLFWIIVVLLAGYGAGYVYFTRVMIAPDNVRKTLQGPAPAARAHGLVVFTGGSQRIDRALDQVAAGFPGPVLITGVHPDVPDSEIVGQLSPGNQSQIELDHLARSTRDNVKISLGWAERHDLTAITLVTSYYHIPRSLRLFDEAGVTMDIATMPVFPEEVGTEFLLREYSKYLLVRVGVL